MRTWAPRRWILGSVRCWSCLRNSRCSQGDKPVNTGRSRPANHFSGHESLKVTRLAPEFAWEIPGFQEPLPSNSYPESPTEVPPLPFPVRHSRCDPRLSHSSGPAPPPAQQHKPSLCLLCSPRASPALHFSRLPPDQGQ